MNAFVSVFCVAVGGCIGALARFELAMRFDKRDLPAGTFAANIVACALLGIISALPYFGNAADAVFNIGFCATLSTFSALAFQIADMLKRRKYLLAACYPAISLALGITVFFAAQCAILAAMGA